MIHKLAGYDLAQNVAGHGLAQHALILCITMIQCL